MAKVKLTPNHVKLIKHLHDNLCWKHESISDFLNLVSRVHVTKILNKKRWVDIDCPTIPIGQELYYRYLNKGNLD